MIRNHLLGGRPTKPTFASMSLGVIPAKSGVKAPDTPSQYALLLKHYAKKGSSTADDEKGFPAKLAVDTQRVYFPGQIVKAKVELPDDLEGIEEIQCDVKGILYTHGYISTGSGIQVVMEKEVIWQVATTLPPSDMPPSNVDKHTELGQFLSIQQGQDPKSWSLSARVPESVSVKKGHGSTRILLNDVLPTFKMNNQQTVTNFVVYCYKLTAKKAGMKRNFRIWAPFVVAPLSPTIPRSINERPLLVTEPDGQLPTPGSIASYLPQGWTTFSYTSKMKKALLITKAVVSMHLFMPAPLHIPPGQPVPVLLHVAVSANKAEDLASHGSVRLPDLPFGSETIASKLEQLNEDAKEKGKAKADASKEYQPIFELVRYWNSNAYGGVASGRGTIPTHFEWDSPSVLSSVQPGTELATGYAWTDPVATSQAGLLDASDLPKYTRSALLTGRIIADVTPPVDTHHLQVKYNLYFKWAQPGLNNNVKQKVTRWVAGSGVTREDIQRLGERPDKGDEEDRTSPEVVAAWQELDARALGLRSAWVLQGKDVLENPELAYLDADDDDSDQGRPPSFKSKADGHGGVGHNYDDDDDNEVDFLEEKVGKKGDGLPTYQAAAPDRGNEFARDEKSGGH